MFTGITHGLSRVITIEDGVNAIISFMIGYIYFTFFFVMIFQMILSYGTSSTKYESIMNQVNEYMKHKQLPIEMQQRLISFYEYKFQKRYFREIGIANSLSGAQRKSFLVLSLITLGVRNDKKTNTANNST